MAHSSIIQISEKKLRKDDYVECWTLNPAEYENFADYIDDAEDYQEEMEFFDSTFGGIFTRKGNELTYNGCDDVINQWLDALKEKVNKLNLEAVKKESDLDTFRSWVKHGCGYRRIYIINGDTNDYHVEPAHDFILDLFKNYKPGDKFYIGGILDYHF